MELLWLGNYYVSVLNKKNYSSLHFSYRGARNSIASFSS